MKKTLLFILLAQFSFVLAQGQNSSGSKDKAPKFDAAKFVGIFFYEENKAIKKIKIKKKNIKYSVKKELSLYNSKIKKISFLKRPVLDGITNLVNSTKQISNQEANRDFGLRVEKALFPIRDSIKSFEKKLNAKLKTQLSKKQFKYWLKHQKAKKRELLPKAPERRRPPPRNRNMRNRRRY
jgi:ATP-dependent Lon protease